MSDAAETGHVMHEAAYEPKLARLGLQNRLSDSPRKTAGGLWGFGTWKLDTGSVKVQRQ